MYNLLYDRMRAKILILKRTINCTDIHERILLIVSTELIYMLSSHLIINKCAVKFRIFDMPNFLNLDYKFMEELVKMPSNSKIFESEYANSNDLNYNRSL